MLCRFMDCVLLLCTVPYGYEVQYYNIAMKLEGTRVEVIIGIELRGHNECMTMRNRRTYLSYSIGRVTNCNVDPL